MVNWFENLTTTIQHDSYRACVQELLDKSDRLAAFISRPDVCVHTDDLDISHLQKRGEIRRSLYERCDSNTGTQMSRQVIIYEPRDRKAWLAQSSNVYQITRIICQRRFEIYMKRDLQAILRKWKLIGGFHEAPGSIPNCLHDLMESDIAVQWGDLVNFCRITNPQQIYKVLFRLCLLSFGSDPDMDIIRFLAALNCLEDMRALRPPSCSSFSEFEPHTSPTLQSLSSIITTDLVEIEFHTTTSRRNPKTTKTKQEDLCEAESRNLAAHILEQWPGEEPTAEGFEAVLIDAEMAMERIRPEWQRLFDNRRLSDYIVQVQRILDRYKGPVDTSMPRAWNTDVEVFSTLSHDHIIPSISKNLLGMCGPPSGVISTLQDGIPRTINSHNRKRDECQAAIMSSEVVELRGILDSFGRSSGALRQQYVKDLKQSLMALQNASGQSKLEEELLSIDDIGRQIRNGWTLLRNQISRIRTALAGGDCRLEWLSLGNLWPGTPPTTILEQLRSSSDHNFGEGMKESIVRYGMLVTNLQQLLRMRDAQLKSDHHRLREERKSKGHVNWKPLADPDWLLFEIDSNLLLRSEQVEVARAIISPASGYNTVLQMNMGKGESIVLEVSLLLYV